MNMKKYKIHTTHGVFEFTGMAMKETNDWHYYDTTDGVVLKFRKEHMVLVEEGKSADYGFR